MLLHTHTRILAYFIRDEWQGFGIEFYFLNRFFFFASKMSQMSSCKHAIDLWDSLFDQ